MVGMGVRPSHWNPNARAKGRDGWSEESEPRVGTGLPGVREGRTRAGSDQERNKTGCRVKAGLELWRSEAGVGLGEMSTRRQTVHGHVP